MDTERRIIFSDLVISSIHKMNWLSWDIPNGSRRSFYQDIIKLQQFMLLPFNTPLHKKECSDSLSSYDNISQTFKIKLLPNGSPCLCFVKCFSPPLYNGPFKKIVFRKRIWEHFNYRWADWWSIYNCKMKCWKISLVVKMNNENNKWISF